MSKAMFTKMGLTQPCFILIESQEGSAYQHVAQAFISDKKQKGGEEILLGPLLEHAFASKSSVRISQLALNSEQPQTEHISDLLQTPRTLPCVT